MLLMLLIPISSSYTGIIYLFHKMIHQDPSHRLVSFNESFNSVFALTALLVNATSLWPGKLQSGGPIKRYQREAASRSGSKIGGTLACKCQVRLLHTDWRQNVIDCFDSKLICPSYSGCLLPAPKGNLSEN